MTIFPDGRILPDDAAEYLNRKKKTLAEWRSRGTGPRFVRVSGRIFYFVKDLDDFIQQGAAKSCAQARMNDLKRRAERQAELAAAGV
jgi:hypothetical protein